MATHNSAARILVLQHADPEHLGLIAEAVRSVGASVHTVRADLDQPVPSSLDGYSGLIIMGGPQAVYEEETYPYLRAEKRLTREAIDSTIPVLGVCLGSQIIADVLGSHVRPGLTGEVGWKEVQRDPRAANDPVISALPETFTPLHWHGDVYDLPPKAVPIAASDITPVQGFTYGGHVYAILFHLEMTEHQIYEMVELFPDDVRYGGFEPQSLISETAARTAAIKPLALSVFSRWARLVI